jgi:serine/threonine protein kinase/tetratricopeptide (TPR) repeat protein
VNEKHHARVKELFLEACRRPLDARDDFLVEACGDDEELRQDVESLLAHHEVTGTRDGASSPLAAPLLDLADVARRPSPESPPERIGDYRILQTLGEGGMGVVYEAEQIEPVRRRVALKVIKWGMDTKAVVGRFESERQALALMNHPNIASVYDAGATKEGRPFFTMELVHGEPITAYCDKQRLTVKERIDLFLQICEGVQHAHQKGIIHRDIKPSNILVTISENEPVPKIIDFGVAKATSQRLTEKTVYTELGQWIGTPDYMSPEQAEMSGLDIDTRTDVYSLGVVLYELLVGAQPFDGAELRRAGFEGIRRILRDVEPPRPSTKVHSLGRTSTDSARNRRAELPALERELRGDLDWISMKALEKDRTRRYGSPSELAEDIRRHLTNQPVLAGPPNAAYRVRKFVRRHRVGVAAGAFVLLALVVGVIGTTAGMMRAVRAERVASEEAAKAKSEAAKTEAINEFLQDILGSASPQSGLGREPTVVEALDAASQRIDDAFRDQPEIEAAVRNTMGRTYVALDRPDVAESELETALQIRKRSLPEGHPDIVESLNSLAEAAYHLEKPELAEKLLRDAVSMGRSLEGMDRAHLCDSLDQLALLMTTSANYEEAKELHEEAVALARELYGDGSEKFANVLHNSGVAAEFRGDFAHAESIFRRALARLTPGTYDHAVTLYNIAWVFYGGGDESSAEIYFRDARDVVETVLEEPHGAVVNARSGLAMALAARGHYTEAEELYRSVLKLDADRLLTLRGHRSAQRVSGYGALLAGTGHHEEGEQHLVRALGFMKEELGVKDLRTQRTLGFLVALYEASGNSQKVAEYRALLELETNDSR